MILIKTHEMRDVEIDPETRTARAQAGALWMDVTAPAHEHGLAALAGSSPDVGVVGYTLGGGLSWLSRTYGVAANSVTAIEVVTADGQIIRTDADNDPALFWALRGGGGSFGIVTAIEFTLYPVPEVYAGVMFWPIERAAEVLHAWHDLVPSLPESMTTVGRLLMLPPIPEIPEPLRGRKFVVVEAIHLGDEREGAELLAPLRELAPEMDTVATIPTSALSALHMDPEHPVPGAGDGMLLSDLEAGTIDEIAGLGISGALDALLSVELRQLGGAIGRPTPGQGAVGHFDAAYAMFAVGIAPVPPAKQAVHGRGRHGDRRPRPAPIGHQLHQLPRAVDGSGGDVPAHRAPPAGGAEALVRPDRRDPVEPPDRAGRRRWSRALPRAAPSRAGDARRS